MVSVFCPCDRTIPGVAAQATATAAIRIRARYISASLIRTTRTLEIERGTERDEPRGQDTGRTLPLRTIGVVLKHHGARIQRVIEIQIRLERSRTAESEVPRKPEIQLIESVAIDGAGLDHLYGDR